MRRSIAHRLSTIRDADRIAVMERGRIAELGRHEDLVQIEGGVYRRLVELQQLAGEEAAGEEAAGEEAAGEEAAGLDS